MSARRLFICVVLAISPVGDARAERAIEDSVVFIECTDAGGQTSRGSGVVVTEQGHVLTAKHVVPDGAQCKGKIGVADANLAAKLVVQPLSLPVDAALLRFTDNDDYFPVPFCEVKDWMIRKRIFVAGFPGNTETGAASYREGVLATTIPNQDGLLETDGQTVEGMSGGPVFSKNLVGLIGIVAGVKFTGLGTISYYGILPVAKFADDLELQERTEPCYNQTREVDFFDEGGNSTAIWRAGDGPLELGVRVDDGFCFIQSVFGEFNHPDDEVSVTANGLEYELSGESVGGGTHGATARCVLYE